MYNPEYFKLYRVENKESMKKYERQYYQKNREKYIKNANKNYIRKTTKKIKEPINIKIELTNLIVEL
jgi:hypothetical protein